MARTLFAALAITLLLSGCSKDPVLVSGQDVFTRYCATCHQQDGKGIKGAFPSLHDSEWVSGRFARPQKRTAPRVCGGLCF